MMTDHVDVRPATQSDCHDLAEIHALAWYGAYQGLLQGVELQRLVARRTADWWQGALHRGVNITVLEVLGKPAGYATFGTSRLSALPEGGEIYELYIRPDHQGLGFGRQLFLAVRKDLAARQPHNGLAVQVLSENQPARNFYRALGGKLAASSSYRSGDTTHDLSIYAWPGDTR
ncbi:GNAT family N-acetyltransferase [Roseibium sp. CAU 1637]|uniref:GNAT family N-acetyltransferase n=2 Tax=Roseibium limicola TaxID=2816037 RepID=A0A939JAB1_9HYPH|nr:GNAT family N-acetyltransferase [Roseibium limicola]